MQENEVTTAPDPLREDEVELVAEAAYLAHVGRNKPWPSVSLFQKDRWRSSARAAILRLDQVRGK